MPTPERQSLDLQNKTTTTEQRFLRKSLFDSNTVFLQSDHLYTFMATW